jgi:NAD(P)-dependent dehydrogenase (short-subunit alcohol dehydrogenase family)
MTIADRAVLVTGANRGIGQALVDEALRRGASRVYAGTRRPLAVSDGRVTPVTLDVANPDQIRAAADAVDGADNGDEEIFPDPMSESMADSWRSAAAKALERQYAASTKGST